jgi:hypothetical protein
MYPSSSCMDTLSSSVICTINVYHFSMTICITGYAGRLRYLISYNRRVQSVAQRG